MALYEFKEMAQTTVVTWFKDHKICKLGHVCIERKKHSSGSIVSSGSSGSPGSHGS